jgi:hypothetical protein
MGNINNNEYCIPNGGLVMNGRRILVAGGMLLVLMGLAYAAVYIALFKESLEKTALVNLELALDMATKGQTETARGFVRALMYAGTQQKLHWLISAHMIGSGLIAMAISSFVRALELKKKWERILCWLFVFGGAMTGGGFFLQLLGYQFYGWGASLLGYAWLLISMIGYVIALVLYGIAKAES